MKSFIGLALIAVLCSVELSQAAAPTANTLKVTDKNHITKADRETEFTCEFTTVSGDTINKVGIYKEGVGIAIIEVTPTAKTVFTKIDGKINNVVYDKDNVDFHKATFTAKKADAPGLDGNYFCKVTTDADYSSTPLVVVYADAEIATLALAVKDPADKTKPTEFKDDNTFEGSCVAEIATVQKITKMDILNGDNVIATAGKELTFTYTKFDGFPDGGVEVKGDVAAHKATITITKTNDKSAGNFKCRYSVEDSATPPVAKADITSNVLEFKHINGAAANVASLTLLVLAVTSYIKLSL